MILVTGTPRSGTSLIMQTLQILGVELIGHKYASTCDYELNKKGVWELEPTEIARCIDGDADEYKNKAIKLFSAHLLCVNPLLVEKIILCVRKKEDAIPSIMRLFDETGGGFSVEATEENANLIYEANFIASINYVTMANANALLIQYDDMIFDSENTIKRINNYIGGNGNIVTAIENIGV